MIHFIFLVILFKAGAVVFCRQYDRLYIIRKSNSLQEANIDGLLSLVRLLEGMPQIAQLL